MKECICYTFINFVNITFKESLKGMVYKFVILKMKQYDSDNKLQHCFLKSLQLNLLVNMFIFVADASLQREEEEPQDVKIIA